MTVFTSHEKDNYPYGNVKGVASDPTRNSCSMSGITCLWGFKR